jgi:hypothetical protein
MSPLEQGAPAASDHKDRGDQGDRGGDAAVDRSSQYTNAMNMPMAPWAKLKIPDVVRDDDAGSGDRADRADRHTHDERRQDAVERDRAAGPRLEDDDDEEGNG